MIEKRKKISILIKPHQKKKMKKIKKASNREEGDKKGKLIISKCLFHKKKVFLS